VRPAIQRDQSRRAYILKRVARNELAGLVRAVNKGEVYIAPKLTNRMLIEMTRAARRKSARLTHRTRAADIRTRRVRRDEQTKTFRDLENFGRLLVAMNWSTNR
jgi:hypothetical protein